MASTDARAFPTKNTAYRVTFPIFDADGDLVTGATGLDSEVSKDGGTFADCTNEATEIATSSGMYYLDLTSTEMNADTVAIIVKTSSSGAKTTPMVFYPATLSVAQLGVNAVQIGATAQTGRDLGASVLLSSGTGAGQISLSAGAVLLQATQTGVTIPTVTTLTNLPAITSNWLTAAGIAASALNGKGDWNVGKTGYALTATTGLGNQTANITGNLSGSVGSVTTVSDKTGYALSSAGVQAIWDALTSALTTVGSIGKRIVDYLTGDAYARLGAPVGASISADVAAVQSDTNDIQTRIPAALVSGRIDASVGAMAAGVVTAAAVATGAIDADALAADAVTEIWAGSTAPTAAAIADAVLDEDMTAHQTQGTLGQAIGDPVADTDTIWALVNTNLNATISSRASQTSVDTIDDFLDTEVAAILADTNELQTDLVNGGRLDLLIDGIKSKTDLIPASPAAVGDIPSAATIADAVWDEAIAGHVGAGSTGAALSEATAPSAAAVADAVWDEALSGHLGSGSTGEALNAAGAAGDPWTTTIPGAYGAGSAGYILGNNVNATISSRASQTSVDTIDDFLDTEVAAILADTNELQTDLVNGGRLDLLIDGIKAKTDLIPASPAATGDIPTAAAIADAVLDEDMTAHQTQGTLGQAIGDPVADSDTIWALVNTNLNATVSSRASQTSVDTIDDFLDTEVAAILADTNELQTDLVNGGRLDLLIDGIKAKTDNLPTDPADQSAVEAAITTATSGLATAAALDVVDNFIDTEIAAIKAKTDLIPASPAAVGDIPTAAQNADAVWDEATVEVSQGIPPATPTFRQAVTYLYMALRNRVDVVATFKKFYNDAGTVIWKKALADDGTTYTESEGETGP